METAIMDINKKFGLDYNSLIETLNGVIANSIDRDLKGYADTNLDQYTLGLHHSSPVISFMKKIFPSLENRCIVEIGPNCQGILGLSYLHSLGAKTYGIDPDFEPDKEIIGRSKINYINDNWANISKLLPENFVDAIYVTYMQPSPHLGTEFYKGDDYGNHWEGLGNFEKHVAQEMSKVLKTNGLYICKYLKVGQYSSEYLSNYSNFDKYIFNQFSIESYVDHNKEYGPDTKVFSTLPIYEDAFNKSFNRSLEDDFKSVHKYPLNPEDKNLYFGKSLYVFQKKD